MRLILIVLLIYAIFSFIMRHVVPSMMQRFVNDFHKQYAGQNQNTQQEGHNKKEGEISITYMEKSENKKHNPDNADYIDYEEIK